MLQRLMILLILAAIPWAAEAQNNNLTLWLGGASYRSTDIAIFAPEDFELTLELEKGGAAGLSFNRFWSQNVSTEFTLLGMGSDVFLRASQGPLDVRLQLGEARFGVISGTVLWHFRRGYRVEPYAGGGLAAISGEIEVDEFRDEEIEIPARTIDLDLHPSVLTFGGRLRF